MLTKMKKPAVVLGMICALFTVGAGAASAAPTFTSTSGATIFTHPSVSKFVITNMTVTCTTTYTGVAPSVAFSTLTMTPTFTDCKAHLPTTINATVTGFGAGGCDFVLHATGPVDLKCAGSTDITITAGTCVVHIAPQDGLGTITYDTGDPWFARKNLTLTASATTIQETHTDGFLCPLSTGGSTDTGVLVASLTATAKDRSGALLDLTDH